jgi:hypothetical protein
MTAKQIVLIILLAGALIACDSGVSKEKTMTAEEALNQVKKFIDATIAEIAPDADLTLESIPGGTTCEGSLTGPTGQRSYGYGFNFSVPDHVSGERLVRETAELWKKWGHVVGSDLDDKYSPFVHTGENGFDFDLTFARQTLRVSVGGSTPCVDPLPGDA